MPMRRVKFVWGGANVIKGRWYLGLVGFYGRTEGSHDDGLAINLRRLLPCVGLGAIAGYVAAAAVLFWFWQRNPYSLLAYSDALLRPIRGGVVHDKQGQAFIAQGTDALRGKRWGEGKSLLERGLALHPNDLRGRIVLAQFYVAANEQPAALRVLQDGLKAEFPGRAYLTVLFDAAEQGDDYGLVTRTCARYLPLLTGETVLRDRRWLLRREFGALRAAHQFAETLVLADAGGPGDVTGENRVLALLGLGRREEALTFLEGWRREPGVDAGQVLRLKVRVLRELNRFEEMERAVTELREMLPADPQPAVYGVVQCALAGRAEAAKAALEDYIFRFGGSAQNILFVAEPLAETGDLALLERCVAAATERGYGLQPFQVLVVQTEIQRGDWAAARRALAAMASPAGPEAAAGKAWRDWMQRLLDAAAGSGDTAPVELLEFLRGRSWTMIIFRRSIAALRLAGREETARDVVSLAERQFPASEWLQAQAEEVTRAWAARDTTVAPVPGRLPPERIFFQQLEAAVREGNWAKVEPMLREARAAQPAPAWIATRDADLRFAQLELAQARGATPEMLSNARLYLNGAPERAKKVLDVARASYTAGDRTGAMALVREVLRSTAHATEAQRLLIEWQQTPASEPPAAK